ncbi:MAG: hypothetical protein KJ626_03080 [Verrucomicrobia bacterium]|nr:hypothetical protein [Verrucomicrobiota bacterium]
MKRDQLSLYAVLAACLLASFGWGQVAPKSFESGLYTMRGEVPPVGREHPDLMYQFNLADEEFYVHVPPNYTGYEPFGVFTFISPGPKMTELPEGWAKVMEKMKLIFVAPQRADNNQYTGRRGGLAVVSALGMDDLFEVNRQRMYVGGFSGGARMACRVGFYHPEIFSGVIAISGAEYRRPIENVRASQKGDYGLFVVDAKRAAEAKKRVGFAFVTGSKDFRQGNIQDIYYDGFLKDGFRCRLLESKGMGHQLCDGDTLTKAIQFIESSSERKKGKKKVVRML